MSYVGRHEFDTNPIILDTNLWKLCCVQFVLARSYQTFPSLVLARWDNSGRFGLDWMVFRLKMVIQEVMDPYLRCLVFLSENKDVKSSFLFQQRLHPRSVFVSFLCRRIPYKDTFQSSWIKFTPIMSINMHPKILKVWDRILRLLKPSILDGIWLINQERNRVRGDNLTLKGFWYIIGSYFFNANPKLIFYHVIEYGKNIACFRLLF